MIQKFLSGYLSKRMKTYAHTETCAQMFIADLFIITWKIENNCLPTCGWINKWWLIHKWSAAAKSLQSFPTVRPHRWQPTRLHHPWDSPGKNTGVGCHFLLQCMKVKSENEVTQSCPTLSDLMDCSLPGFSIHGIFQARVLEWGAIAFSKMKYYSLINNKLLKNSAKTRWLC